MQVTNKLSGEVIKSDFVGEEELKELKKTLGDSNKLVTADLHVGKKCEFEGLKCIITQLQSKQKIIVLRML